MLENQIAAYELNGQRIVTTIQLIKALGGGWNINDPMMTNRLRNRQQSPYSNSLSR
jgi:hypothetical protein